MKASQVGKGSLDKFFAGEKAKREQRRKQLLSRALGNGIRVTFSTVPTPGEVAYAKELRKQVN